MSDEQSANSAPDAGDDCQLCPLPAVGLIRVAGPDAATFLQGQLTQDVRRIDAATTLRAAYCSPKGRVLATLRLFARDGALWLWLPAERAAPVVQRLKLFVLRARVELADATATLAGFGLAGTGAAARLAQMLGVEPPASPNGALDRDGVTLLRLPGTPARYALFAEPPRAARLQAQLLAAGAESAGAQDWDALDIAAGLAEVVDPLVDAYVPQMLNLDLTDGISFAKGCYTGQEIVARTHYLGQLKRRLYRARLDLPEAPPVGTPLAAADAGPGETVGQIVASAPAAAGGICVLAVALIRCVEAGTVRLGTIDGPEPTFDPLPGPAATRDD